MSLGDFHNHSSRSDGLRSPTELIDLAARRGVRVMALTDHDTLEGLDEARAAAAKHPGFMLIPGVELGCDIPKTEVHMLGLFVDESNAQFVANLDRMRNGRIERGRKMVEALDSLGAPIEWSRVQELAGEASIGRPHVARVLVERGHVETIAEAFDRYLGRNSPAYVEREQLTPPDAVAMIRSAGGLPIFAHPPYTDGYESIVTDLAASTDLFGMEVYYKAYEPEQVEQLRALADRLGLFALGGSDYHGLDRVDEREPGDIPLPDEVVTSFLAAAREQGCVVPEPTPVA